MDNRPIGFFDSGLGGLTCIPHLIAKLPKERIIYFGDTARTPYGSKAISTIKQFSLQITDFLVKNDVKMIVIACNTVTSTCLELLQEKYPKIPIVGIIHPAVEKVASTCQSKSNIGIIGTKVTINNGAYQHQIQQMKQDVSIFSKACPIFVPLIEEGIVESKIMDLSIQHYLDTFIHQYQIDTLVLGCTHYPLIRSHIERLYPNVSIIDPSQEVIAEINKELTSRNLLSTAPICENIFYASDLSENFINMIHTIFINCAHKVAFKSFDLV